MITAVTSERNNDTRVCVSIAIIAWNEEEVIDAALQSLWQQSIFKQLSQRGLRAEIICVANGCTDQTAAVARRVFEGIKNDPAGLSVSCRVIELSERGKNNAWNVFVHSLSATHAGALFLMDADILIQGEETFWNMYNALEASPLASVAVDEPLKDIALNPRKSLCERISIATSGMTRMSQAQLSGQLYCIRTAIARQILLPRDLAACEDGFIKALVCTDFLTGNICPDRIVQARGAAHVFQSYRSVSDVLRNQKRQMIGQTIVHILIDKYLKELPIADRLNIATTLRARECSDRDWLKRLIAQHLREVRFFWRLFPNLLRFRFERWRALPVGKRISYLPSALTGYVITLVASHMAFRYLKQGSINYWPDTRSPGLKDFVPDRASERLIRTAIQP